MQRRHFSWLILIALLAALVLAACGGDDNGDSNDSGTGSNGSSNTVDQGGPDLAIAAVELDPAEPAVGEAFTLRVIVANEGNTDSAAYNVEIVIRDVQRQQNDPVATVERDGLGAGERVTVFESTNRRVEDAGSYQVQVTLQPTGPDAHAQNNTTARAFTVN